MLNRFPPYSGIRLSTRVTCASQPTSLRARFEPMNPNPPVMSTRFPENVGAASTMSAYPGTLAILGVLQGQTAGIDYGSVHVRPRCGEPAAFGSESTPHAAAPQ